MFFSAKQGFSLNDLPTGKDYTKNEIALLLKLINLTDDQRKFVFKALRNP